MGFELRHKAIIDRFGRYPHRNALLGRNSTPKELVFLKVPGSAFLLCSVLRHSAAMPIGMFLTAAYRPVAAEPR